MRNYLKIGLVSLAVALATPAVAGVHVGGGVGLPFVTVGDPCYGLDPLVAAPYYCSYPVYSGGAWVDGVWVEHPGHFRVVGGRREFFVGRTWRPEGRGAVAHGRR